MSPLPEFDITTKSELANVAGGDSCVDRVHMVTRTQTHTHTRAPTCCMETGPLGREYRNEKGTRLNEMWDDPSCEIKDSMYVDESL